MPDYALKNIPADLYSRLEVAAAEEFRSIDQEILARLSRSFDAQDARLSALHARWVQEALTSGEPTPLKSKDLAQAFRRGAARARARKVSKAA
jgi:hypothetical protein